MQEAFARKVMAIPFVEEVAKVRELAAAKRRKIAEELTELGILARASGPLVISSRLVPGKIPIKR